MLLTSAEFINMKDNIKEFFSGFAYVSFYAGVVYVALLIFGNAIGV